MFKFKPKPSFFDSSYPYLNQYHSLTKQKVTTSNFLFIHPAQSNNLYFNDNNKKQQYHTTAPRHNILNIHSLTAVEENLAEKIDLLEEFNSKFKIKSNVELKKVIEDINSNYKLNVKNTEKSKSPNPEKKYDSKYEIKFDRKSETQANNNVSKIVEQAGKFTKNTANADRSLDFLKIDENDLSVLDSVSKSDECDEFFKSHWAVIKDLIQQKQFNKVLAIYQSLQRNQYDSKMDIELFNILLKSISARTIKESIEEKLTNYLNVYKNLLDVRIRPNTTTYNIILYNLFKYSIESFKLNEELASSFYQIGLDIFHSVKIKDPEVLGKLLVCMNLYPASTSLEQFRNIKSICQDSNVKNSEIYNICLLNFAKFYRDADLLTAYFENCIKPGSELQSNENLNSIAIESLIVNNKFKLAVELLDSLVANVKKTNGNEEIIANYLIHFVNGLVEINDLGMAWEILHNLQSKFLKDASLTTSIMYEKLCVKYCLDGNIEKAFEIWNFFQAKEFRNKKIDWNNDIQLVKHLSFWKSIDSDSVLLQSAINADNKAMVFKVLKKILVFEKKIDLSVLDSLIVYIGKIDQNELITKIIISQSIHHENHNNYLSAIITSIPATCLKHFYNIKIMRDCFTNFNLLTDDIGALLKLSGIEFDGTVPRINLLASVIKEFHSSEYISIELPDEHKKLKNLVENKFGSLVKQYNQFRLSKYVPTDMYDCCALLNIPNEFKQGLGYDRNWDIEYEIDLVSTIKTLLDAPLLQDAKIALKAFSDHFNSLVGRKFKFTVDTWKLISGTDLIEPMPIWLDSIALLPKEDIISTLIVFSKNEKTSSGFVNRSLQIIIENELNVSVPLNRLVIADTDIVLNYLNFLHNSFAGVEEKSLAVGYSELLMNEKKFKSITELSELDIPVEHLLKSYLELKDYLSFRKMMSRIDTADIEIGTFNILLDYCIRTNSSERISALTNAIDSKYTEATGHIKATHETDRLLSFARLMGHKSLMVSLDKSMPLEELSNNLLCSNFKDQVAAISQLRIDERKLITQHLKNLVLLVDYECLRREAVSSKLHDVIKLFKLYRGSLEYENFLDILKILTYTSPNNLNVLWDQFTAREELSSEMNFFFCPVSLESFERVKIFSWFYSLWRFNHDEPNIERCKKFIDIDICDELTYSDIIRFQ